MTRRIQGILFDKDGTLIDFNRTWLPVYQRATVWLATRFQQPDLADALLLAGGYQPASQTWEADSLLASGSNAQILDSWQTQIGERFDDATLLELTALFAADNIKPKPVIPAMRSMLLSLRDQGFHLGVATMDDEQHARETLLQLDILDTMGFVCGADSGYGVKPDAGMVDGFCKQLQIPAANVIVVGDSPRDLHMAYNAGAAAAVGVLTGASSKAALSQISEHVLESIGDLPEWLLQYS